MQRLTQLERDMLAVGLRAGKSYRKIGKIMGRDHSVLVREARRNTGVLGYSSLRAAQYSLRRLHAKQRCKLDKDPLLREYVEHELAEGHSPEQIAGTLKEYPPRDLKGRTVSHESIYKFIYSGNGIHWYRYLRKKGWKRKTKQGRKQRVAKTKILERISIHVRPEYISDRSEYGHWEADTLGWSRKSKEGLSVHYERKSQLVSLARVMNPSAEETEEALRMTIESYPRELFKSITFDNGSENANHRKIRDEYNLKTYFCDPYKSWQKGGVENMNGLIREYFPKGTDFTKVTDADLREVERKLNTRPRKGLAYKTPLQVIHEHLMEVVH
jgi:transposase, IS30 family